jgi:hypothetical protein
MIVFIFAISSLGATVSLTPTNVDGNSSDVVESEPTTATFGLEWTSPNPVGYWDMSPLPNGRIQNRAIPNGSTDGIVNNATQVPDGARGGCYQFNSVKGETNANIECPDPYNAMQFNDGTLMTWIRTSYTGFQSIMCRIGNIDAHYGWDFGINVGLPPIPAQRYHALMLYGGPQNGSSNTTWVKANQTVDHGLTDGSWHHVAVTFQNVAANSLTVRFFYDGIWDGDEKTVSNYHVISNQSEHFVIGNEDTQWWPSSIFFNGSIDEVKIFNQVLNDDQIWEQFLEAYTDDFDDGTLSPWTALVSSPSIVDVSNTKNHSQSFSLHVKYSQKKVARASSPSITGDFTKNYSITLWYYAVNRKNVVVVDDGRLEIVDLGGKLYAVTLTGNKLIGPCSANSWHNIEISATPSTTPSTSQYQVLLDGVSKGTFSFKAVNSIDKLTVGSKTSPVNGESGEAYWDDFRVIAYPR